MFVKIVIYTQSSGVRGRELQSWSTLTRKAKWPRMLLGSLKASAFALLSQLLKETERDCLLNWLRYSTGNQNISPGMRSLWK